MPGAYAMNLRADTLKSDTGPRSLLWTSGMSAYQLVCFTSTALTLLIFFLITLGGLVRNAGAGLSCPDWPLCFGHVVPPMSYQVFLEWFHRLIAGSVSAFLLALSAIVFWKRDLRRTAGKYCGAALFLLMMQVVLGGLTVLGLLDPVWVSSHLAVGMAFFGTVLILTLKLYDFGSPVRKGLQAPKGLVLLATIAGTALYGQIILGGLVSSNYAGLACRDFPTCNGSWIPPFEGLVRFQFMHRVGAFLATLSAVVFLAVVWNTRDLKVTGRLRMAVLALPGLLTIQILLGVGSVFFQLPLLMSVAHLGTAAALFGMLLVTNYEIRRC